MIIIKKDELTRQVADILAQELDVSLSKLTPDSDLVALGGHSLTLTQARAALEKRFDIRIPERDAARLLTLGDTVEYIRQKTAARG